MQRSNCSNDFSIYILFKCIQSKIAADLVDCIISVDGQLRHGHQHNGQLRQRHKEQKNNNSFASLTVLFSNPVTAGILERRKRKMRVGEGCVCGSKVKDVLVSASDCWVAKFCHNLAVVYPAHVLSSRWGNVSIYSTFPCS